MLSYCSAMVGSNVVLVVTCAFVAFVYAFTSLCYAHCVCA